MKVSGQYEKWGVAVLGAVSLALIAHLVFQFKRGPLAVARPIGKTPTHTKAKPLPDAKGTAGKQKGTDELSRYDPYVNVELVKELESRPLPELTRNPFDFVSAPRPSVPAPTATAAAPPPPPPPPPVTLKVMGYTEGKGGADEAMVELCATSCEVSSPDDQVFVVHAGDSVGTRYKIVKITPTVINVEDATLHQTVDLPVPQ
jgi:hypothetical protein